MDLADYRKQIDEIDGQLVSLFAKRMEVAAGIGDYKKEHGLPVLDAAREEAKLKALHDMAPEGMGDYTRRLYESIFALSREYQTKRMAACLRCGLLGRRLGHSYSPMLHAILGSYSYTLFEKEPEDVEDFIRRGQWDAINVTIPYKKTVVPFCDTLSDTARALSSVNTLVRRADGTLYGDNTDYEGFTAMVRECGVIPAGKKALVLGSGGASVTVCAVLRAMGSHVTVISRSGEDNYQNLSRHKDAALIVNTTPVGMFPKNGESPVDLTLFPRCEAVLDLIYNPARTALMQQAEALGISHLGGLRMLASQARRSSELFTGLTLPETLTETCIAAVSRQQENIVLIGMPGSGKSTVARLLAKRLGRPELDADEVLQQRAGMSIPEFFRTYGEDAFRKLETEVLSELGKLSGIVLSTGGGCVTRAENYPLLHQNGRICCLERDLSKLSAAGRPLSQGKGVETLYRERKPLYDRFADITIHCGGTPEDAADAILEALK